MNNEIWLSVEEVSALTEKTKETVRRKCKRKEYTSTFTRNLKIQRSLCVTHLFTMRKRNMKNYGKHNNVNERKSTKHD